MKRFLDDHFLGAVLLLVVMGLIFGFIATYLITFILALFKIVEIAYTFGGGGG